MDLIDIGDPYDISVLAGIAALVVWLGVLVRAYRTRADITTLALVLVVVGLASTMLLARLSIPAPGVWGYLISGSVLFLLWGRHTGATE